VRATLRKLGYYGVSVVFGGFLAFGLAYSPGTWPYAVIGLGAGALLGLLYPLRHRRRPPWFGTALTLALIAGGLLGRLGRATVHDENVINDIGVVGLAVITAWGFVIASRAVVRERST
jgi:hypothetical protein